MFLIGVAFAIGGYALVYYGVDVLAWSRSANADKTRPVPIRYLFGVTLPDAPPKDEFHPPFTLNATNRANAVIALGGGDAASVPAGAAVAPPSNTPTPGQPNGGQLIVPILPGEGGQGAGGVV